jgi:GDP-4-dehydro-6-deoxy-D-mannose reductase
VRLLITGVTGFVGLHLARLARSRGHEVVGVYLGDEPSADTVDDAYEADLSDGAAMAEAVRSARPDGVVHLGGLSHVGGSWKAPGRYFQVNVRGTEHLLRALAGLEREDHHGPVPVVVASSGEVYGAVPEAEQPIPESREVLPQSPYALTKAAAERLALSGLAPGARVARCFNLIGPGQARTFALPAFAEQLAAIAGGDAEPVIRVGNLAARRDFLHVEDGAAAYLSILEHGDPGAVYNIASGEDVSIAELLDLLRETSGVEARVEVDPKRMRAVDLPVLKGDAARLRDLGWTPAKTVGDAVRDLWQEATSP